MHTYFPDYTGIRRNYTWTLTDADGNVHTDTVSISGTWSSWTLRLDPLVLEIEVRYLRLPSNDTWPEEEEDRYIHALAVYGRESSASGVFRTKEEAKAWLTLQMVGEDGSFPSLSSFLEEVLQDED